MSILPVVLPRLKGVWLAAYRAIWVAAAAVTLVSAIGATLVEMRPSSETTGSQGITQRTYGFGFRSFSTVGSGSWHIAAAFSPEAIASGIHSGDVIVGLNGHAVTSVTPVVSVVEWLGNREGEKVVLRLRSPDGAIADHVLVYRERNVERWYRGSGLSPSRQFLLRRFAYDLMTLLLLGVAAILFLRRSHDPVAAAFSLGLCLIPVGPAVEFWAAIHANTAYDIISSLPYIVILMAGCAFPDGRYWPSWTRFSLIVAPLVLVPAIFSVVEYSQFTLFTAPGFLAVVVLLTLRYRKLGPGVERQQFRWVAFGLAAGVVTLIMRLPFVLLQATLTPAPLSSWIDLAGSFLHAFGYAIIGAGFGISLLKYRLFDAESFIGRSAALTATTLMLAGLWAAFEKAIETFLPNIVGNGYATISGVISAGLAVVLVTPIHGRVHEWIEKRFQNGVYRLREKLPELLRVLSQRGNTRQLCEQILARISRDVRVTRAALVLQNVDGPSVAAHHAVEEQHVRAWLDANALTEALADDDQALFVFRLPLVDPLDDKAIGWLLLGPRPDGTPPNRDERDALETVAAPIAHAILTAEARDARESRLTAILDTLETRLLSVEARLSAVAETV